MAGPLKRRPPGGIEIPKAPKQELFKPASDKRILKYYRDYQRTLKNPPGADPSNLLNPERPAFLRTPLGQRLGGLGKKMGKLGVVGTATDAIDWAMWQTKEAKRRKAKVEPEV